MMPIYDWGKSDPDGRGMARALDKLNSRVLANARVSAAGDVPDPTPAPDAVNPGTLARLALKGNGYDD